MIQEKVSLREYVDTHFAAIERNSVLMEEQRKLLLTMLHAESELLSKSVDTRFEAIDKATALAAAAVDKRLESMNEFRSQIADQARDLLRRSEALQLIKALEDKIELQRLAHEKSVDRMAHLLTIETYETRHIELQRQVNDLRESRSETSGKLRGAHALWGYIVAIAGIVLALVFHFVK